MAGLRFPLSTLHVRPLGYPRMTRGRECGYSFHLGLFHPLLYAGLSRRFRTDPFWEELDGVALGPVQSRPEQ